MGVRIYPYGYKNENISLYLYPRPAAIGTTRALLQGVQFVHADLLKSMTDGENPGGEGEGEDPSI